MGKEEDDGVMRDVTCISGSSIGAAVGDVVAVACKYLTLERGACW